MSEQRYEFRQPVQVRDDADSQWLPAVAMRGTRDDGRTWCRVGYPDGGTYVEDGYATDNIRPDPDYALVRRDTTPEPARTGWRLPEPGDVVRVKIPGVNFEQGVVKEWQTDKINPVVVEFPNHGRARYSPMSLEAVRLHDAPVPAPTPEPLGTLDACRKQVIADNAALEALAVQLEQDGHDALAALARSLMRQWGDE